MAQKFVAPNTIFDSSVAFLKNVNLDSTFKFDNVILSTIDTSAEGLSQSDTALPTAAAVKSYVDTVAGGKDQFSELLDVSIASRLNDDLVRYNSTSQTWDNASLADLDLATLTYVDGSLLARDTSIANLVTITTNLDTSIQALDLLTQTHTADIAQLDASIVRTDAYQIVQDVSIAALENAAIDGWNGLTKTDNSIGLGGVLAQDTSISGDGNLLELHNSVSAGITQSIKLDGNNIKLEANDTDGPQNAYYYLSDNAHQFRARNQLFGVDEYTTLFMNNTEITLSRIIEGAQMNINLGSLGILMTDGETSTGMRYVSDYSSSQLAGDRWIPDLGAVKSLVNDVSSSLGDYLPLAGGELTGALTITGGGLLVGSIGTPQDVSIYSSLYVHGTTTIGGDLNIDGSLFVRDVESIDVSSAFIKLNTGETGSPPASMQSGIVIDRGTELPYVFIYDESTQAFRVGIAPETAGPSYDDASTQAVATREDNPLANGIGFWNNTESRIDTDAGFIYNPTTDLFSVANISATGYLKLTGLAGDAAEQTALLITPDGSVVTRELGTLAFENSVDFANILYVDGSLSARDTSIAYVDALAQDLSTNKLDAVATTGGTGGHDVYSGETDNIAYVKRLVAGTGASIISDSSTVTISVTGAAGYMSKYTDTFSADGSTSLTVPQATHGISNTDFALSVAIFEGTTQIFPEIDVDAGGDVTATWTAGAISGIGKFIISG